MKLSIHSPDELVAALPHLLGFKPEESVVFVPTKGDLPTIRIDLPTTPRDCEAAWGSIVPVFSRYAKPGASMGIVCLCADRQHADQFARELANRLGDIGIDTDLMLWANDIEWCDLDSGETGLQTDAARDGVAAMTAMSGLAQPLASREALAPSLVGDRKSVAKVLPKAREAAALCSPRKEATWALDRLMKFHSDGLSLNDRDATRLLVAIESVPVRDRLWGDMNRATKPSHVALWTDLTRRAPDEVRAAPASLLALASWLSGDGAKALCAIDQVLHGQPYSLAKLVSIAVQTGMHPREWESTRNITPVTGFAPQSASPHTACARSTPGL